jgi:chemotaxis protein MotB
MRPWSTSSSRRGREQVAGAARSMRRGAALAGTLVVALVLGGCVSWGAHRELLGERDHLETEGKRLAERVRLLEASNESLSNERVALIQQVEDLREARLALEAGIAELEEVRSELETSLERRERELAARQQEVTSLRDTYDGLVRDLQGEVATGRIVIEQLREGLRVNLAQEILFPLGSSDLGAEGEAVLRKVAERLASLPNRIEVEGHTDDLAIRGALAQQYPTNWELGGARPARVVRLFASAGIDPARLRAVSLGETQPLASNEAPEGRARNRRIEIRLVPLYEPGEAPPAAEPEDAEGGEEAHPS